MVRKSSLQDRTGRVTVAALVLLTLLWGAFALLSGADKAGGGWAGLLRNSPNALPWVALLAVLAGARRWPFAVGAAVIIWALLTMVAFATYSHPVTFALITVPYLCLGALLAVTARRSRAG